VQTLWLRGYASNVQVPCGARLTVGWVCRFPYHGMIGGAS